MSIPKPPAALGCPWLGEGLGQREDAPRPPREASGAVDRMKFQLIP